jgi:ADP-ribosylglycohydrolase
LQPRGALRRLRLGHRLPAPRNPHPDSILYRSSYQALGPKDGTLHEQATYGGQKDIHYHQFLKAGENTLNVQLCRLLIRSLNACGGYDADDYFRRYIAFMTTTGSHRDTYIEECHRHFFASYARGIALRECGVTEKHIGGLVMMVPIVLYYHSQPDKAR